MIFHEKSSIGIVYLGHVRVARRSPFRVRMAFQAGFIIAQILGNNWCRQSEDYQCQHDGYY
jgi:hypothetical protein